jgi:hypothetical protein
VTDKRDPLTGIDGALDGLLAAHATAIGSPNDDPLHGARGPRQAPRYRSEATRCKLTLDIDLMPSVAEVLRTMSEDETQRYGDVGPVRMGDLGTTALMLGLLAIDSGSADFEAEWTARSRGTRCVSLGLGLETEWRELVRRCKIDS